MAVVHMWKLNLGEARGMEITIKHNCVRCSILLHSPGGRVCGHCGAEHGIKSKEVTGLCQWCIEYMRTGFSHCVGHPPLVWKEVVAHAQWCRACSPIAHYIRAAEIKPKPLG